MLKILAPLVILVFTVMPATSAIPVPSVPDTLGHVLDADTVSISYTLNPDAEPGDIIPLCNDAPEVPEDQDVLGAILEGCFQPNESTSLPLGICDPVIIVVLPENGPPIVASPNEPCIEAIQDWIVQIVSGDGFPIQINLHFQK